MDRSTRTSRAWLPLLPAMLLVLGQIAELGDAYGAWAGFLSWLVRHLLPELGDREITPVVVWGTLLVVAAWAGWILVVAQRWWSRRLLPQPDREALDAAGMSRSEARARAAYLAYLERDVSNRLAVSIHRLRSRGLGNDRSLDLRLDQALNAANPWHYAVAAPFIDSREDPETFQAIGAALKRFQSRLLLLGSPGSGKTTTLLQVCERWIHEAQADLRVPVPLLDNLSTLDFSVRRPRRALGAWFGRRTATDESSRHLSLEGWLEKRVVDLELDGLTSEVAAKWIREGRVRLLLDGLDEVDERHMEDAAHRLNGYFRRHKETSVVVCSRTDDYQVLQADESTRMRLDGAVTLQPLQQEQIHEYLENAGAPALRTALANDEALAEMARTPLTLSMMSLAYGGLESKDIPVDLSFADRRHELFDLFVERMIQRQARRRAGVPFDLNPEKDVPPPYPKDKITRYLSWLAIRLSERQKILFPLRRFYDFLNTLPSGGEPPGSSIRWAEVGALTILAFATGGGIGWVSAGITGWDALGLGLLGVATALFLHLSSLLGWRTVSPAPTELESRPSAVTKWSKVGSVVALMFLWISIFGLLVNPLAEFVDWRAPRILLGAALLALLLILRVWKWGPARALLLYGRWSKETVILGSLALWVGLPTGLLLLAEGVDLVPYALSIGLVASSISSIHWTEPMFPQRQSVVASFPIYLVPFSLTLGVGSLGIWWIGTPEPWELVLIVCGLGGLLFFIEGMDKQLFRALIPVSCLGAVAGAAVAPELGAVASVTAVLGVSWFSVPAAVRWTEWALLHPSLQVVLACRRQLPWRWTGFLEYGVDTLLLKRIGADYEFMHRLLRDHFAVRQLVPALVEAQGEKKIRILRQLSRLGESSFDVLAEEARNKSGPPAIRSAAIEALGRLTLPQAIPLFRKLLHEDPDVEIRSAVVRSLGRSAETDKLVLIRHAARDPSGRVRYEAARMARTLGRESIPASLLNGFLADEDPKVFSQGLVLVSAKQSFEVVQELEPARVAQSRAEVEKLLVDPAPAVRAAALGFLGTMGNAETGPLLLRALGDPEPRVVGAACEALAKLAHSEPESEDSPWHRQAVDRLVEIFRRSSGIGAIVSKSRQEVLEAVASALRSFPGDPARQALVRILCTTRHGAVAKAATGSLVALGQPFNLELLLALPRRVLETLPRDLLPNSLEAGQTSGPAYQRWVRTRDQRRILAVRTLGRLNRREDVEDLLDLLSEIRPGRLGERLGWRADLQASILDALSGHGDPVLLPHFLLALESRAASVRAAAARALRMFEGDLVTDALTHAADDPDAAVASSAASSLEILRGGRGARFLRRQRQWSPTDADATEGKSRLAARPRRAENTSGVLFHPSDFDLRCNKKTGEFHIFHRPALGYKVSKLEYDLVTHRITVVLGGGTRLDLGVEIQWLLQPYAEQADKVFIIQEKNGEALGGLEVPMEKTGWPKDRIWLEQPHEDPARALQHNEGNRLVYTQQADTFVGRDDLVTELLDRFLDMSPPADGRSWFRWALLYGDAGSGKSRFALEVLKQFSRRYEGAQCGFVRRQDDHPGNTLSEAKVRAWTSEAPAFFVLDPASMVEDLPIVIAAFVERSEELGTPMRLLLLDRKNVGGWIDSLQSTSDSTRFLASTHFELGAAQPSEGFGTELPQLPGSALEQILRQRLGTGSGSALHAAEAPYEAEDRPPIEQLLTIGPDRRPLIAAMLGAAFADGPGGFELDPTLEPDERLNQLIEHCVGRERDRSWTEPGDEDDSFRSRERHENLLALSTLCEGVPRDVLNRTSRGGDPDLPTEENFEEKRFARMTGTPEAAIAKLRLTGANALPFLEPNLVGEWYVLDRLESMERPGRQALIELAWNLCAEGVLQFIRRCHHDFPDEISYRIYFLPLPGTYTDQVSRLLKEIMAEWRAPFDLLAESDLPAAGALLVEGIRTATLPEPHQRIVRKVHQTFHLLKHHVDAAPDPSERSRIDVASATRFYNEIQDYTILGQAASLLHESASFFRSIAEKHSHLREQMQENAAVYEKIVTLLRSHPFRNDKHLNPVELAGNLLDDAAKFYRRMAAENPPIQEQMESSAILYETVSQQLVANPLSIGLDADLPGLEGSR